MPNDNSVIFKGRKSGLVVALDPNVDFAVIKDVLKEKLGNAQRFFGAHETPLLFQGRNLTDEEADELIEIIKSSSGISITYTGNAERDVMIRAETPAAESGAQNVNPVASQTKYCFGSLRSGQSVYFEGSIVIIGDVNPGAEVVAAGHVIVLGALRGLAHAGCSGTADCFVFALAMKPSQLRIADIIRRFPSNPIKFGKKFGGMLPRSPSLAFVIDGAIETKEI